MKNFRCVSLMLTTLVSLMITTGGYSHQKFPTGCRPIGYKFRHGVLVLRLPNHHAKQTLFFLHNTADFRVHIQVRKQPHQTFSPSYENIIKYHSWSVFAMDQREMHFTCSSEYDGTPQYPIDCGQVLRICQFNKAVFAEHNRGTYWVVKSASRHYAVRGAIKTGILLKS